MRERERERESEPIVRSKFNYLFCTHLHKQKSLYIAAMINDYPQSPTSNHQKKNVTGSTWNSVTWLTNQQVCISSSDAKIWWIYNSNWSQTVSAWYERCGIGVIGLFSLVNVDKREWFIPWKTAHKFQFEHLLTKQGVLTQTKRKLHVGTLEPRTEVTLLSVCVCVCVYIYIYI
jgi:hypothetical protein